MGWIRHRRVPTSGAAVKKSDAEYAVKFNGFRVVDDFRGDRILGDCYVVVKFTPSNNDLTEYEVTFSTLGEECSCPGGRHPNCKHRDMVRKYREENPVENWQRT